MLQGKKKGVRDTHETHLGKKTLRKVYLLFSKSSYVKKVRLPSIHFLSFSCCLLATRDICERHVCGILFVALNEKSYHSNINFPSLQPINHYLSPESHPKFLSLQKKSFFIIFYFSPFDNCFPSTTRSFYPT